MEDKINIIVADHNFHTKTLKEKYPHVHFSEIENSEAFESDESSLAHGKMVVEEVISTLKGENNIHIQYFNLNSLGIYLQKIPIDENGVGLIQGHLNSLYNTIAAHDVSVINLTNSLNDGLLYLFNPIEASRKTLDGLYSTVDPFVNDIIASNKVIVNASGNYKLSHISVNGNFDYLSSNRRVIQVSRVYDQSDELRHKKKNYYFDAITPSSNQLIAFKTDAEEAGSSLATPTATAFIAAMKNVNPKLDYRDSMDILQAIAKPNQYHQPMIDFNFMGFFNKNFLKNEQPVIIKDYNYATRPKSTSSLQVHNFGLSQFDMFTGFGVIDKYKDLEKAKKLAKTWHMFRNEEARKIYTTTKKSSLLPYDASLKDNKYDYKINLPYEYARIVSSTMNIEFLDGVSKLFVDNISLTSPHHTKADLMTGISSYLYSQFISQYATAATGNDHAERYTYFHILKEQFKQRFSIQTHKNETLNGEWKLSISHRHNPRFIKNGFLTFEHEIDFVIEPELMHTITIDKVESETISQFILSKHHNHIINMSAFDGEATVDFNKGALSSIKPTGSHHMHYFVWENGLPKHYIGSDHAEKLYTNSFDNKANLQEGDDIVYSSAGHDEINGGLGIDTFHWTATKWSNAGHTRLNKFEVICLENTNNAKHSLVQQVFEKDGMITLQKGKAKLSFPQNESPLLYVKAENKSIPIQKNKYLPIYDFSVLAR